jgi:hypothetical protein
MSSGTVQSWQQEKSGGCTDAPAREVCAGPRRAAFKYVENSRPRRNASGKTWYFVGYG